MLIFLKAGLRLFEKITYLDEYVCIRHLTMRMSANLHRYYLTNAEIEVLEAYAEQIAHRVQSGSVIVELGSGCVPFRLDVEPSYGLRSLF